MISRHKPVITGLGVVAPNGVGIESFWQSLLNGTSGVGRVTLFDTTGLPCHIAGEVTGFEPQRYIPSDSKVAKRMARASQFAVACTVMALEDAGLTIESLRDMGSLPVFMGVSTSAMDLIARKPRPWTAVSAVPHAVGSAISFSLYLDAKLVTVSNGCASGVDAVALAAAEIRKGVADIALAGAADSSVTRYVFDCFARSHKLSLRNDDPEHASRPFDRDRDGGIISEGSGIVVLESLQHAQSRGVRPYAAISGYGTHADPPHAKTAEGLATSMRYALDNAPCSETDIDLVSAHGPSDVEMDRIETELIKRVLGPHAYHIPVTSIKGATGNPMGAGGILQCIATALSIREDIVTPTVNLEVPDEECDLDYVPGSPRSCRLRKAMINTHGFGRGNSSLILERLEATDD